jgi:photosystem I subunit 2
MTLNLQTPFPTLVEVLVAGYAQLKLKKYAITWTSPKEQIFEMPTGGAAIMRNGENLLYLARKEQCLALGTQLRTFKIIIRFIEFSQVVKFNIYIRKMVYSRKVNPGRTAVNSRSSQLGRIQTLLLLNLVELVRTKVN